jgi:hypothetical protein
MIVLKWLAALLLIVAALAVLIVAVTILATSADVKPKDWIEFTAMVMATIGAALSAVVSGIVRRKQTQDAKDLETFKTNLSTGLEQVKARIAEITSREYDAYYSLWAAVARYYRALSPLETGRYDERALHEAESLSDKAEGHSLLVSDSDRQLFYDYWQTASYLRGEALARRGDADALRQLWRAQLPELFCKYKRIRDEFRNRVGRP